MLMANTNGVKRHCMVVYALYPLGETRVQREAEVLVQQGFQVDVICKRLPGEVAQDEHQGVRIFREKYRVSLPGVDPQSLLIRFLSYLKFFVLAAFRLSRLHRNQPYDTVQVHNLPDFLVFTALFPKWQGASIILDLHDLMPEFYTGRFDPRGTSLMSRLVRWQERLSCRFADHVITVSKHWREALIGRGVPAHKVSVVMNVADERIFRPFGQKTVTPAADSAFRLIYHGSVVYRYGLDLAIRAVDQVRQDIPGIHLTILGRGTHMPELVELTRELGLDAHVTLIDKIIPAEELPAFIQQANLGIVPYRNDVFTDGLLPTKLMEYAALGLPAIGSRTTAIKGHFANTMVEFFEPNSVDDLARAIRTLYRDRERFSELVDGCARFTQKYNWRTIGLEYANTVERLANRDHRS
jgi:glycosyltransferase involved in cell wall biosynthesis